jgi:hypothetical protein
MHRSEGFDQQSFAVGRISNPNFRAMAWFTPILFDPEGTKHLGQSHPEFQVGIQDFNTYPDNLNRVAEIY